MGIPERKEREKEHRREEILKAAREVFFEKGLQNSTMDEIAEKAELSKGTLYLYFKSKEDLYLAVMIEGMEILHRMFEETMGRSSSPAEAINQLGLTYYRFYREQRTYFRMLHFFQSPQFHKQVSDEMMTICNQQNQKVWELAVNVIDRGMKEGVFRADLHPAEMAVTLWSAMHALLMRMEYEGEQWKKNLNIDLEKVLHTSNRILLEAMMRVPQNASPDALPPRNHRNEGTAPR